MQKLFFVRFETWNATLAQAALESGVDAFVLPAGHVDDAKRLGLVDVIAPDGDKKIGVDILDIVIKEKADEEKATAAKVPVIIKNSNWTIIPLENLIAGGATIVQTVTNAGEAELALSIMEVGAAGVCLEPTSVQDIIDTARIVRAANNEKLAIQTAVIESVTHVGMADRVCIDTTSILKPGQGALVGDSSSGMFLVYNENVSNEYVNARPFRVNAGAVHAYVRLPGNKTSYLSELKAGSQILICDETGNTFPATVGRAKIERRPMLLVKAKAGEKTVSLVLQNAETIRLTLPDGGWKSVTQLAPGDEVLVYIEEAGRHFGMQIRETITEK